MKKINVLVLVIALGAVAFSGCEQNNIMSYQQEYTAVNFLADSTTYSFLGNSEDQYVQEIPLRINGDSSSTDRSFNVEVVDDSLTTAEASDYKIGESTIPAGQFEGILPVTLYKTDKLSQMTISLHLRITPSADFEEARIEDRDFVLRWTNKVVLPPWTFYRVFFTSSSSTTAYQLIVQVTGLTELGFPEIREYGQNGLIALGRQFGDYVKQYNLDHPDDPLIHEDGPAKGELIEPIYYTQSKFD